MPYKKRYVTKSPAPYKKNNKRYKKTKRKRVYPLIAPARMLTRFRYIGIDTAQLPLSGTTVTYLSYHLNGLYDVSPAALSTNIPGFDGWGTIYSNYRALDCTITASLYNPDVIPIYFGILAQSPDTPFAPVSWSSWREMWGNKYCKQVFLGGKGSANDTATLRMKVDFGQMLGDKKLYSSNLNYRGEIASTNPNQIFPLYVFALTSDASTPFSGQIPVSVNIEWNVLLTNRELQI